MRRKPIKNTNRGCAYENINTTFPIDRRIDGESVHYYFLNTNEGLSYRIINETLKDVISKLKKDIDRADVVELQIDTPLYDETYELNKDDNEFYLVEKGIGYA